MKNAIGFASVLLLGACATQPAYVSSSNYQSYDCAQLNREFTVVNERLKTLPSGLASTGVGVGIVGGSWGISPQVSMGMGRNSTKAQKAQLLGEVEALERSAEFKNCTLVGAEKE